MPESAVERFLRMVSASQHGCWLWTGAKTAGGYGCFKARSHHLVLAHRWSYEWHFGPIPEGLQVDHLCRNRACVNPEHLEAVTPIVNTQRAHPERAACPAGHPYDPENTRVTPSAHGGRPSKACRTCDRERARRNRSARAAS